ncbi:hypothetical protein [Haloarcula sp. Atlit-7R]|uniref:hypothetical protein n=1 Tax=Haloarcula sp. Atlit-7R TaxID=2282125 RepID=UPI000EF14337|nr:hypothetical protein [Haloarcula sp. Atlit-7R]RLM94291.1 hypothetical protein D3D01_15625 [Haloarcula sp. Atlit-7R]
MTILTGEQFVCETIEQFFDRTSFELADVLEAIDNSDTTEMPRCDGTILEDVQDYHKQYPEEFPEPITEYREIPREEAMEYIWMIGENQALQLLLERDEQDWVHLYNGMTHNFVKVTGSKER